MKKRKPHKMTGEIVEAYEQYNRAWGLIRTGKASLSADNPSPPWAIVALIQQLDEILGNAGLILAEFIDGEMIKTGAHDAKNPD